MRYLRVVLPLLCVREACTEPKTGAAALELDTRPLEGAPPLLDGTERGARGAPLLGPTQINQYKELQTIKMKNDAMFGEVKTINKNGRIDLTWESDTLGGEVIVEVKATGFESWLALGVSSDGKMVFSPAVVAVWGCQRQPGLPESTPWDPVDNGRNGTCGPYDCKPTDRVDKSAKSCNMGTVGCLTCRADGEASALRYNLQGYSPDQVKMVGDGTSSAWKFNEVGEGTGTGVRRKTVTSREDGVTTLRMHIPWTDQCGAGHFAVCQGETTGATTFIVAHGHNDVWPAKHKQVMVYPVLVTRPLYDGPLPESYPGVSRDESGATVEIQGFQELKGDPADVERSPLPRGGGIKRGSIPLIPPP